jgi:tRNA (guanine26-N2/guanine27-N2)-dimethyltransferase
MGARILLGAAIRELARCDKGGVPMLTHATDHYVRTYIRIRSGARAADRALSSMGYIEHCRACGSFVVLRDCTSSGLCPHCGGGCVVAGPLWIGPIHQKDVIASAVAEIGRMDWTDRQRALRLLELCRLEIDHPMYYDHHNICEAMRITPGKIDDLVKLLRESGFEASRTHFSGIGIKTAAQIADIIDLLRH